MFLKPGETVEVRPNGEGKDPVYRLRAPLVYDRVKLLAAVTRQGGREHNRVDLLRALRRDVLHFMADSPADDRDRVIGMVDAALAKWRDFGRRANEGEFKIVNREDEAEAQAKAQAVTAAFDEVLAGEDGLAAVEGQLRQAGGVYANACAEAAVFQEIFAIEAARLFLVGWDGLKADFRRGQEGVPDAVLMALPAAHLAVIAARVEALLKPDEETAKNSAGPSSGAADRSPSTARKTPPKKPRSKVRTEAQTAGTSKNSNSAEESTPATSSPLN